MWESIPDNIRQSLQQRAATTEELRAMLQRAKTIPAPEAGMPEAGVTEIEARLQREYPNYEYIQFFGEEGVRYTGEASNKITGETYEYNSARGNWRKLD